MFVFQSSTFAKRLEIDGISMHAGHEVKIDPVPVAPKGTAGASGFTKRAARQEVSTLSPNIQATVQLMRNGEFLPQKDVIQTVSDGKISPEIIDKSFPCTNMSEQYQGATKLVVRAHLMGTTVSIKPGTVPDKDEMAAINQEMSKYGYPAIKATAIARPADMVAGRSDDYVCIAINCQYYKEDKPLDYGRKTYAFLIAKNADAPEALFLLVGGVTECDKKGKPVRSDGVVFGNARRSTSVVEGVTYTGVESTAPFLKFDAPDVAGEKSRTASKGFVLKQNYPNPFNASTMISYRLPKEAEVGLKVYNVLGQEVFSKEYGAQGAGEQSIKFDAENLPSGVYTYRISAGEFSGAGKMILTK